MNKTLQKNSCTCWTWMRTVNKITDCVKKMRDEISILMM